MLSGPLFVGNGVMLEYSEWLPNSMFLASLVVSEETVVWKTRRGFCWWARMLRGMSAQGRVTSLRR